MKRLRRYYIQKEEISYPLSVSFVVLLSPGDGRIDVLDLVCLSVNKIYLASESDYSTHSKDIGLKGIPIIGLNSSDGRALDL